MRWTPNRETVMSESEAMIRVENLSVAFLNKKASGINVAKEIAVTDNVSFEIRKGEFFALVGESGCGKSVTAMSILRLLPTPGARILSGRVWFKNQDLLTLSDKELQRVRGAQIACIFQEPMSALNPVIRIRKQLEEALPKSESFSKIEELLRLAGFNDLERVLNAYPHELSGGMLQRICIVMALLPSPALLIADEPTTALDVTVQAAVLDLLKKMAQKTGTAVLLITHNMGIVAQYAARAAVMYAGRIVECGPVHDVILHPLHPYTRGLLDALPAAGKTLSDLKPIPGTVPPPSEFAVGCRFKNRCFKASAVCKAVPEKCGCDAHYAYCFFPNE